jgi:hypothetical protein
MKRFLLAATVLAFASTSAFAWTDRFGHWHEGPQLYGPINPGAVYAPYGAPPAYGYGPVYGGPVYGGPVIVAPPPTDTQVIAGTIMGIAGMAIDASMYRRHW